MLQGDVQENARLTRLPTCPQITIDNTIAENDEEDENTSFHNDTSFLSLASSDRVSDLPRTRRVSENRPKFYIKTDRKYSLIDRGTSKIEYHTPKLSFKIRNI